MQSAPTMDSVTSRQNWRSLIADVMKDTYLRRHQDQGGRLERGSGLFKAYLVETHADRDGDLDEKRLKHLLTEAFSRSVRVRRRVHLDTIESRFFRVSVGEGRTFMVDCTTPRYWSVETIIRSADADPIVRRLVRDGQHIDQLWLSGLLQERLPSAVQAEVRSISTGFGTRRPGSEFESDGGPADQAVDEDASHEGLAFRAMGADAQEALEIFRRSELRRKMAIQRVTARQRVVAPEPEVVPGEPVVKVAPLVGYSDLWYHGKLTLRGTANHALVDFMDLVRQKYAAGISAVEERLVGVSRGFLRGEPIQIVFEGVIGVPELVHAVEQRPDAFKLVFTHVEEVRGTTRFDVVDLHTGDDFKMDMRPVGTGTTRIEVLIGLSCCANVLPRLLTNLQQYVDATAACPVFDEAAR